MSLKKKSFKLIKIYEKNFEKKIIIIFIHISLSYCFRILPLEFKQ